MATPDPLKSAYIEGQNLDTPQRMPGHTKFYERETTLMVNQGV